MASCRTPWTRPAARAHPGRRLQRGQRAAGPGGGVGTLRFDRDQLNLTDQWSLHEVLPQGSGLGVIAKRPIANAPWRFADRPTGHYAELYWERLRALDLDPVGLDWDEFALRFTAYAPGVDSAIVGTSRLSNLQRNLELVERGPLPAEVLNAVETAWQREGQDWAGSV